MELQLDMIILWNTACITFSTFYLTFKFRRDFIKLKEDVHEIKLLVLADYQGKTIILGDLEFDKGHADD